LEFFKDQFGYDSYQRLRFMLLRPSGYINPHSDNKVSRPLAAINISLNNPDNCQLVSTKGRIPFRREGSIFMFNNHYTHVASNDSTEDRFHIIVHGRTSKIWHKYIANAYKKAITFL
jgi:aspartyl/asparaginyl beta-hydroxylase (cupin superfamily)